MRYLEFSYQRNSVLITMIEQSDAKKLKQLCRIRWVERMSSYNNFWELFQQAGA